MAIQILLDARKLGDGGIGVYVENLVDGLLELGASKPWFQLNLLLAPKLYDYARRQAVPAESQSAAEGAVRRWLNRVEFSAEASPRYSVGEYLFLAGHQRELIKKCDIFHSPHYTLPFFLGIPAVVTIHDVIHLSYPDTPVHSVLGRMLIKSALSRADHLITVSEHSRREIERNIGEFATPVTVIGNACRIGLGEVDRARVDAFKSRLGLKDYLLFVGSDRAHKGFQILLQSLSLISREGVGPEHFPQLVCVGTRYQPSSIAAAKATCLKSSAHFFPEVTTEELSMLYSGCQLVVVPSLEEGFGLVPMEAICCFAPVLSTPLPSVKEVCRDAVTYSADFTPESFAMKLRETLMDGTRREKLAEARKHLLARFDRLEMAKKTVAVYESVFRGDRMLEPDSTLLVESGLGAK